MQDAKSTYIKNYYKDLYYSLAFGALIALLSSIAIIIVKQLYNGSNTAVAIIQSSNMFGLLGSILYVKHSIHMKSYKAFSLSQFISWILVFFAGMTNDVWTFTACVSLAYFTNQLGIPLAAVTYKSIYPAKIRGKLVSQVKQWNVLARMAVTFLAGYIIKAAPESYRYLFIVFAIYGLYTSYCFSTIVPDKEEIKKKSFSLGESFAILLQDLNFTKFLSCQFLLGIANLIGVSTLQIYVNDEKYLLLDPMNAALIIGVIPYLTMFLSLRVWGRIFDKLDIVAYRTVTSIVLASGFILMPFFGFTGAAIGTAIWGLGRGGGQIAWSIGVLKFSPPSKEANYLGIHTFLTGVRGAVAPFIAISFLDMGLEPEKLFLTAFVLILLSAYLNYKFVKVPD